MVFLVGSSCIENTGKLPSGDISSEGNAGPYIMVLGIAQDAGYPQMNCMKECCRDAWSDPDKVRFPTCLGLVDPESERCWLFEATPEIKWQWQNLKKKSSAKLSGIFLTHAHIGHYTGLSQLGREVMGTMQMPVFAMPRMRSFIRENGPWNQLVSLKNIDLLALQADSVLKLTNSIEILPIEVPHRDEYSETVGFKISGATRSILFIPDIDKWSKWSQNLTEHLKEVDIALIDGSFYEDGELPNRDMSEIPHPFVVETMKALEHSPSTERNKVYFIHLNHTNPLLQEGSAPYNEVYEAGMHIATEGQVITI